MYVLTVHCAGTGWTAVLVTYHVCVHMCLSVRVCVCVCICMCVCVRGYCNMNSRKIHNSL